MNNHKFSVLSWHTNHRHEFEFDVVINNIPAHVVVSGRYIEINLGCRSVFFFTKSNHSSFYNGETNYDLIIKKTDDEIVFNDDNGVVFAVIPTNTWNFFISLSSAIDEAPTFIDALTVDEDGDLIAVLDSETYVVPEKALIFRDNGWDYIEDDEEETICRINAANDVFSYIKDEGIPFRPRVDAVEHDVHSYEEYSRFVLFDEEINKTHILVIKKGCVEFGSTKHRFIFKSIDEIEKLSYSKYSKIQYGEEEKIAATFNCFRQYGNHEVFVVLVGNDKYMFTRNALRKAVEVARLA